MKVVIQYVYMQAIVDFAIETLREKSPVGIINDAHPGLYRDSHLVFLNGHITKDVSSWKPGDAIDISSPVPYARKIEIGRMKMSIPGHIYEDTAQIVASRYGTSANIRFVFMPVRFGDNSSFAAFAKRTHHRQSNKARRDWLSRQPAIEIRGR